MNQVNNRSLSISLLSTYYENIGDDMIREGIIYLINKAISRKFRLNHVSKSNLLSIYFPKIWLTHAPIRHMPTPLKRIVRAFERRISYIPLFKHLDKVTHCDVFVIAGTPIFFFTRHKFTFLKNVSWPKEIFEKRLMKHQLPILLALGIGSLLDRNVDEILHNQRNEIEFLRKFIHRASLITVRDYTTKLLLENACPERKHIIIQTLCPSVYACLYFNIKRNIESIRSNLILVSYSEESAKVDMNPTYALDCRRKAMELIIKYLLENKFIIQLIAHNNLDYKVQLDIARKYKIRHPIKATSKSLLKELSQARAMITWRVHGAMAALSLGCPVLLFKTDSRFETAASLGAWILDDRNCSDKDIQKTLIMLFNSDDYFCEKYKEIDERRIDEMTTICEIIRDIVETL